MTSVRFTDWHGIPALALENPGVSVTMVPAMGAKIVSLLDRRGDFEWLARPMAGRAVRLVPYAAPFTEQDMAGWDEMFPTIVPCIYPGPGPAHGAPLPDHGEAWALPWEVAEGRDDEVVLALTGRALPYRLSRSVALVSTNALALRYTLENLSPDPMPYIWAAHPQFLARPGCEIVLPREVTRVVNTLSPSWGWDRPGTAFGWPEALAPNGDRARLDRVGPPSLGKARKFFAMPDVRPGWAAIRYPKLGRWLRLEWDPEAIPYLGLWVDEGAINDQPVVAPEPTTGWYDDLALAWRNGEVKTVPPRGIHEWSLAVRLGADAPPVP